MLNTLPIILEIQELDIKMIRLMKLKKERMKELNTLQKIKDDLSKKNHDKEIEIIALKKGVSFGEAELDEIKEKLKKLESQQHNIKKVEEFNALSQEMAAAERERGAKEQKLSDLIDQLAQEEDLLASLKETLETTAQNSRSLEEEIGNSVAQINEEGRQLKKQRDTLALDADEDTIKIYERLLNNKKDRVVVPIEARTCAGCHIIVTAQDENLVRKGERLVFCEHCSRIQYWPEATATEGEGNKPTRRRRRTPTATA